MKRGIITILIWALSIWTQTAQAELITIEIEGVVDKVWDEYNYLEGKIKVGDVMTGFYTYESTTPDSNPSAIGGRYEHHTPPYGIFLSVGGFNFQTDPANVDFLVEIVNGYPPDDDYFVLSHNNIPLSNGTSVDSISWWLYDLTGSALSSDALPTTAPVLEDWQSGNLLRLYGERARYIIDAHVTSAVPEPTCQSYKGFRRRRPHACSYDKQMSVGLW
jgi:hypothetical protein